MTRKTKRIKLENRISLCLKHAISHDLIDPYSVLDIAYSSKKISNPTILALHYFSEIQRLLEDKIENMDIDEEGERYARIIHAYELLVGVMG